MLWEIEIHPAAGLPDREAERVVGQCHALGLSSIRDVRSARSFLIEGALVESQIQKIASGFLADTVVETYNVHRLSENSHPIPNSAPSEFGQGQIPNSLLSVLSKPGVPDNVADSVKAVLIELGHAVSAVRTCQKYWFHADAGQTELKRVATK